MRQSSHISLIRTNGVIMNLVMDPYLLNLLIMSLIFLGSVVISGEHFFTYLILLVLALLNLFVALPNDTDVISITTNSVFIALLIYKFLMFILPTTTIMDGRCSSLEKARHKQTLTKWKSVRKRIYMYFAYCIFIQLGVVAVINL